MKDISFIFSLLIGTFSLQAQIQSNEELVVSGSNEVVYFGENLLINSANGLSSVSNTLINVVDTVDVSGTLNIQGSIEFEKGSTDYSALITGSNLIVGQDIKVGEVDNIKLFLDRPIEANGVVQVLYGVVTTSANWAMTNTSTSLTKDTVLILKSGATFNAPVDGYTGVIDGTVVIENVPTSSGKFMIPFKKYLNTNQYERRFFTIYKADGDPNMSAKITFFARDPLKESFSNPSQSLEYSTANEFWHLEITGSTANNLTVGITSYGNSTLPQFISDYVYYNIDTGSGGVGEWKAPIKVEPNDNLDGTAISEFKLINFAEGYITPALDDQSNDRSTVKVGEAYDVITPNGDGANDGFTVNMEEGHTYNVEIYGIGGNGDTKLIYESKNYPNGSWYATCTDNKFCADNIAKQGSYYYRVKDNVTGKDRDGWVRVQHRK